jgi:hypothetical protein
MKTVGGYMFFLGAGSIVLYFMNYEFSILSWVDTWGVATGWAIRVGIAVAGAAIWLLARQRPAAAS